MKRNLSIRRMTYMRVSLKGILNGVQMISLMSKDAADYSFLFKLVCLIQSYFGNCNRTIVGHFI